MLPTCDEHARAVLFISNGSIIGEMLYSEFEAVLDSFIPLPNFAGQKMHAVFVEIDFQLHITKAVFFLIEFDYQGYPSKTWNVPLEQLGSVAAKGPNLGAGPIKLACYTQCPIRWHQKSLWDPEMSPGSNDFALLKRTVKTNKMGIVFKDDQSRHLHSVSNIPTLTTVNEKQVEKGRSDSFESDVTAKLYLGFRNRLANSLKKQRLRLATLRNKHKQKVERLNKEHQARVENLRQEINQLEVELQKQHSVIDQFKSTVDSQSVKMSQLREYFEERLKSAKYTSDEQMQLLNQQFEAEAMARIESASFELKEKIQLREIEIMYLTEHQNNLLDEVQSLRNDKIKLQEYSGERVIDHLCDAGISFVAYQVGLGHINISREELSEYTENPEAFAASKCGVSLQTYRSWLEHFSNPCCQALTRDGEVCGKSINKINSPLDYFPGESDRCEDHRKNNIINFRFS